VNERKNRGDRSPQRRPAEGVRIIRADEAQAALDAGEAAGRRPDDELRFGDVPPAPQGPRPPHRFPLPDSVDPAGAVPLPPLAAPRRADDREASGEADLPAQPELAGWGGQPVAAEPPAAATEAEAEAEDWSIGDRTAELGVPAEAAPPPGSVPDARDVSADIPPPRAPSPAPLGEPGPREPGLAAVTPPPLAPPDEGITVTGGGTDLPHWTDPPTGEVPRILAGEAGDEEAGEDDLEAWNALGSKGMRWRDEGADWADLDEIGDLGSDEPAVGALDQTRSEHSDLYSFDEEFERVEAERTGPAPALADFDEEFDPEPETVRTRTRPAASVRRGRTGAHSPTSRQPGRAGPPGGRADDDLGNRVVVGVGLVVLLAIAYAIGPKALVVLSAAIVVLAAAEAYGMLQRSGFRPATLLGLVATVGVVFGAYWKGIEALPLAVVLVFAGAMMWYLLRIVEARPLANVAVTTMAFVWVGVLGSYSAVMLRVHHGKGLLLGAVLVAIAADIGAFVVGRWIGSRPIAANISPSKTIEGFVGGLVAALVVGAIVGKELTPWGGMKHGLALGLIVGLVAPAGDLFESMIKRDLGVKDSGTSLPGHGGLLDRFDSVLLVLPAAFYLATLFNIAK
jgi:phosphatidate cytidylyltransferase